MLSFSRYSGPHPDIKNVQLFLSSDIKIGYEHLVDVQVSSYKDEINYILVKSEYIFLALEFNSNIKKITLRMPIF